MPGWANNITWKHAGIGLGALFMLNRIGAWGPGGSGQPGPAVPYPQHPMPGNQMNQAVAYGMMQHGVRPIGDYSKFQRQRFAQGHGGTTFVLHKNRNKSGIKDHRVKYSHLGNVPVGPKKARSHPVRSRAGVV